jgi:hypothetical protein
MSLIDHEDLTCQEVVIGIFQTLIDCVEEYIPSHHVLMGKEIRIFRAVH